jgi:hypothetical protein
MKLQKLITLLVVLAVLFTTVGTYIASAQNTPAQATTQYGPLAGKTLTAMPNQWSEWYPMDRGQGPGQRTFNWWTKNSGEPEYGYYGQSTWRYYNPGTTFPNTPDTLPVAYSNGRSITYFFNWQCAYPKNTLNSPDPKCENWTFYPAWVQGGPNTHLEIITESADDYELEHWAFGNGATWKVFYKHSFIPIESCNASWISTHLTQAQMEDRSNKEPIRMKLPTTLWSPSESGSSYVSPPVCAVAYNGWWQNPANVIGGSDQWATGNWFVETRYIQTLTTGSCTADYPCIQAENLYYTDNSAQYNNAFTYCQAYHADNYRYCDGTIGRLVTSGGVTGRVFAFEKYWMRKVPLSGNRLQNGFGSFSWWAGGGISDWDDTFAPGQTDSWTTLQNCSLNQNGYVTCSP